MSYDCGHCGENIRTIRKNRNMTREQLSDKIGYSVDHIKHIEIGEKSPTIYCLAAIAEGLKTDTDSLLGIHCTCKLSGNESVDQKLSMLSEEQRKYFTNLFGKMLKDLSFIAG